MLHVAVVMVLKSSREFPGDSVIRTLQSHWRGNRLDSWSHKPHGKKKKRGGGREALEAKYDTGYY